MKFLSKHINRKNLLLTYTIHVRSHLEYGDIIFHYSAYYLMDTLESIQNQAGLIATGCWQPDAGKKLIEQNCTMNLDGNPCLIDSITAV